MSEYIFIVHVREFFRLNENTYTVGRTSGTVKTRLRKYPRGSKLLFSIKVNDANKIKVIIKNTFDNKFKKKPVYGNDYYNGNINCMINEIQDIVEKYNII